VSYRTPTQRSRQRELAAVRARLVAHLQQIVGPVMTAEAARAVLEQASAWTPCAARRLDSHIVENPTAFTAPSPQCPSSLARLLQLLDSAGHGEVITLLGCAICGRTDRKLLRLISDGRCCSWCVGRSELRACARCGQAGQLLARREEGPLCRRCYRKEPEFLRECAGCGRMRPTNGRRADGAALCQACAARPERECVRCATLRPAHVNSEDGPVCQSCYTAPVRLCGICSEVRTIKIRGVDGRPETCTRCYRNRGECAVCGRVRHGSKLRGGAFHCASCRPRSSRRCDDCGQVKPVMTTWPLGTVCRSCYHRRERDPRPCARCGTTAVLIGRDQNDDICGPCAGSDLNFDCRRCGNPGHFHTEGNCARCIASDRVHAFLSHDGTLAQQLHPLTEALAAAVPWSVLSWLNRSSAATLLASLVARRTEISHELLDHLPQDSDTRYVREILVTAAILPRRQEHLAQLELWAEAIVTGLPPHQRGIIHPFAEWEVLRDARRRAGRGRYTHGAAATDRRDIRIAITFMEWLDTTQTTLEVVSQEHLDLWLDSNPTLFRSVVLFLHWAVARGLTGELDIPRRKYALPSRFLDEQEQHHQLRRCLNDDALPLEVRIIGALVRLYALPVTRILELTTDRFHRGEDGAYLTIRRNPVLLPPRLAHLIEEQIVRPRRISTLARPFGDQPRYLLPGRPPSRPRSAWSVHEAMTKHGLSIINARNTAMIEAVTELPPIVVSDLFGVHPSTAHSWALFAEGSWADYLAACQPTE
jgi:hypothetical protein